MTELGLLRAAGYRFLAALFLYPDRTRRTRLRRTARLLRETPGVRALAFFRAWQPLLERLARGAGEELEVVYGRVFGLAGEQDACPLCESAYRDADSVGELCGLLTAMYREAGLAPVGPEPPDHLSAELEYLSVLAQREAEAWERDGEAAVQVVQAERRFLLEHPYRWVPELRRRLESSDPSGVYAAAAAAAEAFLEHEVDLTGLLGTRETAGVRG
jgi:TorA maturation chaperone TorD